MRNCASGAGTTKCILATHCARGLPSNSAQKQRGRTRPSMRRARGRPGARCTRGLVCGEAQKSLHTSIQVKRRHPAFPAQWFDGLYVLSPAIGLFCHRRPQEALASRELDASVEASGPHDFAVRFSAARPHAKSARRHCRVHRIPSRVKRRSRYAPLSG
jgi:hypothetical protein